MGITSFYGGTVDDDQEAMELLRTVYDTGVRHFDTAEAYGNAADPARHNEVVLGRFLRTVPRDTYSVATKFWPPGDVVVPTDDDDDGYYDLVRDHLMGSLRRLGLDYVDLYYSHRVVSLPQGVAFAKACARLKSDGLVREVGLSEVSGKWLRQVYPHCPIDAVQQEWSILTRSLETELVPACRELGVTVVAYSPLARNLLVQKVDAIDPADWRATQPRYDGPNLQTNNRHYDQIQSMSQRRNCTPAQLSLAWLFAKAAELGVCVVPIPGTTKKDRAVSNAGAVTVPRFDTSSDDWVALNAMADSVVGERYSDGLNGLTIEKQI
jgi:aryl-alcohol dehydrogenase-like predicted oxidoreductase